MNETFLPSTAVMVTLSNYFGLINDGAITITSPAFQPSALSTSIEVAPLSAKTVIFVQIEFGVAP